MAERLQKFLAKSGIGSRRYCEELIRSKKIKVNGQIALIGATVNRNDEVGASSRCRVPSCLRVQVSRAQDENLSLILRASTTDPVFSSRIRISPPRT